MNDFVAGPGGGERRLPHAAEYLAYLTVTEPRRTDVTTSTAGM